MEVENFSYNGFCGHATGGYASYTAEFKRWTEDPAHHYVRRCKPWFGSSRLPAKREP